jgi:hypothetical protein
LRERERERSIVKEERDLKEDIGNPFWKIRVLSRHDAREISSREEELFVVRAFLRLLRLLKRED